jgi:hypothetical protein
LTSALRELTTPELTAFVYREFGEKVLREILFDERCVGWYEMFMDEADELRMIGLTKVADIVAERAEQLPSM